MISPHTHRRYNACLILLLTLLVVVMPSPLFAEHAHALDRHIEPVIVKGNKLGELLGKDIASIRLFAYRGGKAEIIPFQIDQRDEHGNWVWDKSPTTHAPYYDDPVETPCLGQNDELVFMYTDAGERYTPAHELPLADQLLEIEIKDTINHVTRWVYAAHYIDEAPSLSDRRYIHYQPKENLVISPIYELGYSANNIAIIDKLKLNGHSILKRTRIQGKVNWGFTIFKGTINFDEGSINAYVDGHIDGPVRIIIRTVDYLELKSGMTTPEVNSDHVYYKHHLEIPFPISKIHTAKQLTLLLTSIYRNNPFQNIRINDNKQVLSIGEIPGRTNHLASYPDPNWMALEGDNGSVISVVTKKGEAKKYLSIIPYLNYANTNSSLPETSVSHAPEVGYHVFTLPGTPAGEYVLSINYLLSASPYRQNDERKLLTLIHQPLEIEIKLL